ncbi:penicillin acylase family protein [Streptacidiphilus anmyonensis]|uniref:penicillin acylase family protein n=1 Tax=Streptacidiphilus anmyonensis TaxID=405782 RepID=UPI0005AAFCD8|nr:penicillin acylase family protein [Streptacidiphilus anmyonensis]
MRRLTQWLRAAAGAAALVTVTSLALPAAASPPRVAAAVQDYCGGQCNDILPPGENGNATLADILANKVFGTRPAHTDDQLGPYSSLVDGYTGLTDSALSTYFDNSSFGVPANQVESSISPRSDVTIVRDKATGTPHITGTTRYGTEFGAGYAAAQDRLWVMDLFRHVGRGELSSFAGGAAANRQLEQSFWQAAPYTEAELQEQIDSVANEGPRGQQALADAQAYIDGINAYITSAYNSRTFPGEYDLTGQINAITNAGSIQPFKLTDLVALSSVIGALFGSGGGNQVQSALVKEAADAKYGTTQGDQVWNSFRESEAQSAVTTVHDGQSFSYGQDPASPQGLAMPDPGSLTQQQLIFDPTGSTASATTAASRAARTASRTTDAAVAKKAPAKLRPLVGVFDKGVLPGNLLTAKHGMSNALVVSGKYTDDGHPVAVFGPQTGYFAPQLLMLEEIQGPGISARGAAFAGLSFYVELGRGPDYSWSATSAGQDIDDVYAVKLCNTDGSPATKDSMAYLLSGVCTPLTALERDDSWSPTTADSTPAGSYRLIMYRTAYGLVTARATVGGVPVAYTSLRSTYMHEADSIIGFQMLNDPTAVNSPQTFQQAAQHIDLTFNWFYVDDAHTAYYNSGRNPVRPADVAADLPEWADPAYAWQNWNPTTWTADYTPPAQHPQSVDQDYYVSWNNKQAPGFASANFGDGPVHRANMLDSRVKALVTAAAASGPKVTRATLVQAMESAGLTDLRGEDVLPQLLAVIDSSPVSDPGQAALVNQLQGWLSDGAQRRETSAGSHTYADASAIQTFDAWWPLLVQGEFQSGMGSDLFNAMIGALQINESPSGGQTGPSTGPVDANESIPHKGSSFQFGWWSYVNLDLRAVLGQHPADALAQPYCGGGNLSACRQMLLTTLQQAAAESAATVYPADDTCSAGDQWCADSIVQRALGGITDSNSNWQNRPTYQQVVQYTSHR